MRFAEGKVSILPIIVGLLFSPLLSQSSTTANETVSRRLAVQNPYFYEIEFQGKKSFLLGTLHLGVTPNELPSKIESLFEKSRIVYFEKMLSQGDVEASLQDSQSSYISHLSKRNLRKGLLTSPFNKADKNILQKVFHLPVPVIEVLRCEDTLSYFLMNGNYTFPRIQSLDYYLMNQAYKLKLSTAELDTDSLRQTALLKSLESSKNKELLIALTSSTCLLKTQINHPIYRKQALDNEKMISQYRSGTLQPQDDPMVNLRNDAWVENSDLISDLEKGNTFVAVGALHLIGPRGLTKLLSDKGFKIKRLQ
jgi:uncharacterized protein